MRHSRQVWLSIVAGLGFLVLGTIILRHFLKEFSDVRKIPEQIVIVEENVRAKWDREMKQTLERFKQSAEPLESMLREWEEKRADLDKQKTIHDEKIKGLESEKVKAEGEKKRNELEWLDLLDVWQIFRNPLFYPGFLEKRSLAEKLYRKAVSRLNEIEVSLAKAQQALRELTQKLDDAKKQVQVFASQMTTIRIQMDGIRNTADRELRNLLSQDPRLAQLHARKSSAQGLGFVLQLLHLLTGSLCFLMACKSGLRATQLAGWLKPHVLVR